MAINDLCVSKNLFLEKYITIKFGEFNMSPSFDSYTLNKNKKTHLF